MGSAMSLIEILRVLYDKIVKFDPKDSRSSNRDRVILSKGHGCLALYALLADKKFIKNTDLDTASKFESILGGHPESSKIPGVEVSTGALGHGFAIGVGMAIAAKLKKQKHKIYVIIGDGESNEGSIWEAALYASKYKLNNLKVLVDYNKHQSYGSTYEIMDLEPLGDKWRSFGFAVAEVDGHNVDELRASLTALPLDPEKPSAIICHTVKGKGISFVENNMEWHHKSRVSADEIQALYAALGD